MAEVREGTPYCWKHAEVVPLNSVCGSCVPTDRVFRNDVEIMRGSLIKPMEECAFEAGDVMRAQFAREDLGDVTLIIPTTENYLVTGYGHVYLGGETPPDKNDVRWQTWTHIYPIATHAEIDEAVKKTFYWQMQELANAERELIRAVLDRVRGWLGWR